MPRPSSLFAVFLFSSTTAGYAWAQEAAGPPEPSDAAVLAEVAAVCAADAGALWGLDLCGPVLVADPATRRVIANQKGASDILSSDGGVFSGVLPTQVNIANTATDWDGVRWTMLQAPLPEDPIARASLIAHESWHRVQPQLGLPAASPTPAHLATLEGRAAMRLEWRALAAALAAPDVLTRKVAVADALAFRAARRLQGGASAGEDERSLEMNEGLAEYTGLRLSGSTQPLEDATAVLRAAERGASYSRTFAYASGPAYGLLLDEASPRWREGLSKDADLGGLLAAALGLEAVTDPVDAARLAGMRYGAAQVLEEEAAKASADRAVTDLWLEKLVRGPTLTLPFSNMQIGFDPNTLRPLPPHGTVYPTLRVSDVWGVLEVTDGALIDGNWSRAVVAAPLDAGARSGPGWTLTLKDGWSLDAAARAGDFVARRVP